MYWCGCRVLMFQCPTSCFHLNINISQTKVAVNCKIMTNKLENIHISPLTAWLGSPKCQDLSSLVLTAEASRAGMSQEQWRASHAALLLNTPFQDLAAHRAMQLNLLSVVHCLFLPAIYLLLIKPVISSLLLRGCLRLSALIWHKFQPIVSVAAAATEWG